MADTPPPPAIPKPPSRLAFVAPLLGVLIVLLLAILVAAPRVPAVWSFRQMPEGIRNAEGRPVASENSRIEPHVFFPDPDDYTRVYRAMKIADGHTKRWGIMKEIDAPNGVELHWTAPMDYLVAGAGYWGEQIFGRRDGFATGAALLPLALGLVYLLVLMGLTQQLSNWGTAILCGAFCAVTPSFHRVFELGHADHHCLMETLLVLSLALLTNFFVRQKVSPRTDSGVVSCVLSGIVMGCAVWTAAQSIILWGAVLMGVTIVAILGKAESRHTARKFLTIWSCASACVMWIAYYLDGDAIQSAMNIDRIGRLHYRPALAIGVLLVHFVLRDPASPAKWRSGRLAYSLLIVLVAASLVSTLLYLPEAIRNLNSDHISRWHALIAELQPLSPIHSTQGLNFTAGHIVLEPIHARLGFTLYLLPIALSVFAASSRNSAAIRWIFGLLAPLIVVLSLFQLRWFDHYATFVLPVIAVGIYDAIGGIARAVPRLKLTPPFRAGLAFVILAASSIPFMTWSRLGLLASANAAASVDPAAADPRTRAMLRALAPREDQFRTDFVARAINMDQNLLLSSDPCRNILCEEGEGPTLLYETGLPVVAAPYHRAIGGIVSMMEFFAERDPIKARALLDALKVRYIVVPYHVNEQLMNFEQIAFGQLRSFDPPTESTDSTGRLVRKLNYKPEVAQTMAYRLAIRPLDHGIPGVKVLYTICDDPNRPDEGHGLLFVVE